MSMEIAIPTHRRAKTLVDKTLALLKRTGADMSTVTLFVSDEKDLEDYTHIPLKIVLTGARNVVEKFNYIHNFYPVGTEVVVLEDDIEDLVYGEGTNEKQEFTDFPMMCQIGFSHIKGGGIWGVVPHHNTFFMKKRVKDDFCLVVAHCFGFISTQDERLMVTQLTKSDYERSILYYIMYGRTVRIDFVGVKTKSYTAEGGMQSDYTQIKRYAIEKECCTYLVKRYPHLVQKNVKKTESSMFPELTLKRNGYTASQLQKAQRAMDLDNNYQKVW